MFIVGLLVSGFCVVICCLKIRSITRNFGNVKPNEKWLWFAFFVWFVNCIHRIVYVLFMDSDVIYDGTYHEYLARNVAANFSHGDISVLGLGYFSNDGYRSLLGLFYYLTDAPQWATFVIHASTGFFGLLVLLETITENIYPTKLPLYLVLFTLLLPSALIFTPWILKEGPMLLGIAIVQRFSITRRLWRIPSAVFIAMFAALMLLLLRPHIGAGWTIAAAISHTVTLRSLPQALLTILLGAATVLAFVYAIDYMAPGMSGRLTDYGVVGTLEGVASKSHGGSAIIRTDKPIPLLSGMILVFLEPNPTMWQSLQFAVCGIESYTYLVLISVAWIRCRNKMKIFLSQACVESVLVLVILSFYLGYMYNMGLLVRQRIQVVPAIILLAAIPLGKHVNSLR